jgi:hypothetical protein
MTPTCEALQPTSEHVCQVPPAHTDKLALDAVLEAIRQDSKVCPGRYLKEVVVPFGGE